MQVIHSPKTVIGLGSDVHKNIFYCLGWLYMEHIPYPIIWHNGGTLMKTMVAYVPEQKIGVVVLSNYVTQLPELLAFRFFDQYAGKPAKDLSAEGLAYVGENEEGRERQESYGSPKSSCGDAFGKLRRCLRK